MTVAFWYPEAFLQAFDKEIDFLADDIKVSLHTAYTPSLDHDYWADAVASEVSGTGYTHEGLSLTGEANTRSSAIVTFDANDAQWTSSTIDADHAIYYDSTPGSDATDPLISYVDFEGEQSSSNGNFTITHHANGIATITAATP
jgi:hypothetical protein